MPAAALLLSPLLLFAMYQFFSLFRVFVILSQVHPLLQPLTNTMRRGSII